MNLKPVPLFLISAFSAWNPAFANGGVNGAYGSNDLSLSLIGEISQANPGTENSVIGNDGNDILGKSIFVENISATGSPGENGGDGVILGGSSGGGGRGGDGGGSVIGGVSNGGSGGSGQGSNLDVHILSADGGNGGDIKNSTITIIKSNLNGGIGGNGGWGSANGGEGGGSVFGGQSNGGNAGENADSANGGSAGDIAGSSISISGSTFFGADGGLGSAVGQGGGGGGSVFGGLSIGGNANIASYKAIGGNGGNVFENIIEITDSDFLGGHGGEGGMGPGLGAGDGGNGGGSILGGFSSGGDGGISNSAESNSNSDGGTAGKVYNNKLSVNNSYITGGVGGVGGNDLGGGASDGGLGGGSIFGGLSIGGNGGTSTSSARGGDGGAVFDNTVYLSNSKITGGVGGDSFMHGDGGYGGGSIYGGLSIGGNAGNGQIANGGDGGDGGAVSGNKVYIVNSEVNGANGGEGGEYSGYGGHGGGSVFGGFSSGGTVSMYSEGTGGRGGNVHDNFVLVSDSIIKGATGGAAGTDALRSGMPGGSIYGGYSVGGSGNQMSKSGGGMGGDVYNNKVTILGDTEVNGNIYGGYSQGGTLGEAGEYGLGGKANANTVTLIGDQENINGFLYGGLSVNGDGNENIDPNFESFYQGNTLQIQNGHIKIQGIKNFQNYNWLLPQDEFDGDVIVSIENSAKIDVNLNNTVHRVDVDAEGNTLQAGDQVVLINKVSGTPGGLSRSVIEQGFFIVYDAEMVVEPSPTDPLENRLVLNVFGLKDGIPDGKVNPESEAFLKGRVAQLAIVDQGADMISDGIGSARASLREKNANLFAIVDGGSNRYMTVNTNHIKINDVKFAAGAAKAFTMNDQSVGMIGVFLEHGNGDYNSYNDFGTFGEVRGNGKTRYNGGGALFHVDVANTDVSKVKNKPNIFDSKYGLYVHGALRFGHAKVDFHSADIVNGYGVEGRYGTKSRYVTAMAGAGYVLTLDDKKAMDFYGRYTFSRLNGKNVQVVDEQMSVGAAHSQRLRVGARYGYAYSEKVTSYAGLAYERNFSGDVTGSAYGFTIKKNSLKGNTGILEAGVIVKPKGANDSLSLNLGLQGYVGDRKGVTAAVRARYVF